MYYIPGSVFYIITKTSSSFPIDWFIPSYAEPGSFTLAYVPAWFRVCKYVSIHFNCQEIHAIDFLVNRYCKEKCDFTALLCNFKNKHIHLICIQ